MIPSVFDPLGWQKIGPEELAEHIFEKHLVPDEKHFLMRVLGVPRYDIELARHRGISLQSTINNAVCQLIEKPEIYYPDSFRGFHETEVVIRALAYMQELKLGELDIDEVIDLISGDRRVLNFGIDDMSSERPFRETYKGDEPPYSVFEREVLRNPHSKYWSRLV